MENETEEIAVDDEGYLIDPDDWTLGIARQLAEAESIEMTPRHWFVVNFVRSYFEENQRVPQARTILKALEERFDGDAGTRKALYQLFPYGYGQQACKIAGMRKPLKLMLDV